MSSIHPSFHPIYWLPILPQGNSMLQLYVVGLLYIFELASVLWYKLLPKHQAQSLCCQFQHFSLGHNLVGVLKTKESKQWLKKINQPFQWIPMISLYKKTHSSFLKLWVAFFKVVFNQSCLCLVPYQALSISENRSRAKRVQNTVTSWYKFP